MSFDFGDVPTWISAISATGALIAAGFAAWWTSKTATSAGQQVVAVREQVEAEREQLELAKGEAERQQALAAQADERAAAAAERERVAAEAAESRAEAAAQRERAAYRAAEDRFLRAQLDTRAPTVYARATPGSVLREHTVATVDGPSPTPLLAVVPLATYQENPNAIFWSSRYSISETVSIPDDKFYVFVLTATIQFVNSSDVPARIDFPNLENVTLLGRRWGQELVVPPREARHVVARRKLESAGMKTNEGIGNPNVTTLDLEYWVRDLGTNVRDTFRLCLDMRYFERDGSRLTVKPEPAFPWEECFGGQIKQRLYEQLDTGEHFDK
ncbi:hypothetical protein [Amycolatopsis sp. cg9]|uniref:hypothetical protein n=1 Tax=Amycolatopsis sp. cg9 TaxID=3238801 RepID=UPI0035234CF6